LSVFVTIAAVVLVVGILIGIYAVFVEPFDLRVTSLDMPIAGLDPAFDGYTISVIADIHQSPWTPMSYLRHIVDASNRADPDLVALLGDYSASFETFPKWSFGSYRRMLPRMTPSMRELKHRDGMVALLGNHDHWGDDDVTADWLKTIGARLLDNSYLELRRGSGTLLIGGVADAEEGKVDPAGGCAAGPPDAPTIVLSHNPDGVLDFERGRRRMDLVLAGHTHGGQVVIPFYGAPITVSKICERKTASGWVPNAIAPLYVSRGVGSQIPIRFGSPPELLIVRLRVAVSS
jgi:uncharacterized protein